MRTSGTDDKSSHKLIELTDTHAHHAHIHSFYNQNSVSKYDTQHTIKQAVS